MSNDKWLPVATVGFEVHSAGWPRTSRLRPTTAENWQSNTSHGNW